MARPRCHDLRAGSRICFADANPVLARAVGQGASITRRLTRFIVICLVMLVFIAFETAFAWLRQFLVLFMTSRVDAKISYLCVRQSDEFADGFF